jgi:hypothetical protein
MTQDASAMAASRSLLGWVDVATWLAFIATWLYTAGWSFAYHYFDHFHLPWKFLRRITFSIASGFFKTTGVGPSCCTL